MLMPEPCPRMTTPGQCLSMAEVLELHHLCPKLDFCKQTTLSWATVSQDKTFSELHCSWKILSNPSFLLSLHKSCFFIAFEALPACWLLPSSSFMATFPNKLLHFLFCLTISWKIKSDTFYYYHYFKVQIVSDLTTSVKETPWGYPFVS